MPRITLNLKESQIHAEVSGILTSGMVGVEAVLACDESWEGLRKNLVCRAGDVVKAVEVNNDHAVVAHEALVAGKWLELGVEGRNEDNTVVIPTLWERCCIVLPGVDVEADPSMDPTMPIWAQLQSRVAALEIPPVPSNIGALPSPLYAKIGQYLKVGNVNRIGTVTAVDAVDAPENGFHLAARLTTTEQSTAIEITGLDLKLPVSIRMKNTGSDAGTGLRLAVNGISRTGRSGTTVTDGTEMARVRAWLWDQEGIMYGKATMVNDGINNYNFGTVPERINSIEIGTVISTAFFQAGTVVEVYEGVFPNVK